MPDTMAIGVFEEVTSAHLKQVLETNFSKVESRDWKSYVPESVREKWTKLSMECRLAIYYTAESITDRKYLT